MWLKKTDEEFLQQILNNDDICNNRNTCMIIGHLEGVAMMRSRCVSALLFNSHTTHKI